MPQPDLILTPFAQDAPPSAVDPIPETRAPSDPLEKATWRNGFPSLTMIPLAAGGIPPRGQDFNGVLKAISEHTVYQGGGGQYKWDADYVSANGGYEKGAVIQSDDGTSAYVSLVDNNTDNFNADPGVIGVTWAAYAGEAAKPLSATQARDGIVRLASEADASPATIEAADNAKAATILRVFQALRSDLGGATIHNAAWPVGAYYTQFSEADGSFSSAKSPSALFGGTWALRFNTESVFFRTEGALAAADRSSGVQEDAFQGHWHEQWGRLANDVGSTVPTPGFENPSTVKADVAGAIRSPISDGVNGEPRTAAETRPRNRLIRVWERTA